MTLIKANRDSKCSKCGATIKTGEDIGVEKGKPPLCKKCAPPDAKTWIPKPTIETLWDKYALAFIARGMEPEKILAAADRMVLESEKRRKK